MLLHDCSATYVKSLLVLSSSFSRVKSVATLQVLVDNLLTKPMKDRRPEQLIGVGYLAIASMIDWSIWYPSTDS